MQRAIIYFMEVKASFNLREPKKASPTNINLICRINGKQIKVNIGTQYNVYPKHWDKKTQTAITSATLEQLCIDHNTKVNSRIKECLQLFDEWKQYIAENTNLMYDSVTLLRKYITGEMNSLEMNPVDWFNYYINDLSRAKESSKKQYRGDVRVFEQFITEKKIQLNSFSQFNYDILKKYESYLIEKEEKVTTINNKINTLKLLLKSAENYSQIDLKKNRITGYKSLKNDIKSDNSVYLTEEEITKIENLELTGKKKTVRDIFIVQYYLGQRVSDIANLKNAAIKEKEIELYQKKTNTLVTIPIISPKVKEILTEYDYSFPEIANKTPILNKYIKEIAKEAGIIEEVTYREQIGTKTEIRKAEKWELITTHTARHSYATNMLLKGYDKEIIKKITGHKTDSAFQTYNNITSKDASKFILKKESENNETVIIPKNSITEKQHEWKQKIWIEEYLKTNIHSQKTERPAMISDELIQKMVDLFYQKIDKYETQIDIEGDINKAILNVVELTNTVLYFGVNDIIDIIGLSKRELNKKENFDWKSPLRIKTYLTNQLLKYGIHPTTKGYNEFTKNIIEFFYDRDFESEENLHNEIDSAIHILLNSRYGICQETIEEIIKEIRKYDYLKHTIIHN